MGGVAGGCLAQLVAVCFLARIGCLWMEPGAQRIWAVLAVAANIQGARNVCLGSAFLCYVSLDAVYTYPLCT